MLAPNPDGLVDYYSQQNQVAAVHFPIQMDPTLEINNEAETVYATRLYIFTPVSRALYYSVSTRIRVKTEETASDGNTLSRMDMSWSTEIAGSWRCFAIIEFKRPGTIDLAEWQPVLGQQGVLGSGADNICRQLHKYAHACDTPFVAVCDGLTLIVMCLGSTRETWYSAQYLGTVPNSANYRWINSRDTMKHDLYVWETKLITPFGNGGAGHKTWIAGDLFSVR